jgi:enoyl-CoA hydratase
MPVNLPSYQLSKPLSLWKVLGHKKFRYLILNAMHITGNLDTLHWKIGGPVAIITLNRPEVLNALNAQMFDQLETVFRDLDAEHAVRVVLLTGSGDRAFVAGADIRALVETDAASGLQVSQRGQQVFDQIANCRKPVIACINGVALGGGCELALACSLRIAADTARVGLPEVKLGLIPGYGGTQRLTRLIGRSAALRLMLSAAIVDASEALRLGLVDEVVPAADLLSRATALAETIASMAPLAIAGVLEAVAHSHGTLEAGLHAEAAIFSRLSATADKHEGLTAFLAKRAAIWSGK